MFNWKSSMMNSRRQVQETSSFANPMVVSGRCFGWSCCLVSCMGINYSILSTDECSNKHAICTFAELIPLLYVLHTFTWRSHPYRFTSFLVSTAKWFIVIPWFFSFCYAKSFLLATKLLHLWDASYQTHCLFKIKFHKAVPKWQWMVAVVLFIENTSSCYWLMCFWFLRYVAYLIRFDGRPSHFHNGPSLDHVIK